MRIFQDHNIIILVLFKKENCYYNSTNVFKAVFCLKCY